MELIDQLDLTAVNVGAVNTIKINSNGLVGYNTDWIGLYKPILINSKKIIRQFVFWELVVLVELQYMQQKN